MWCTECVAKSVEKSRKEKKVLMVFIEGTDEQSSKMAAVLDGLSEENLELVKREMVCVKVANGSENFIMFSKIYPVLIVPSIYFITIDGVSLEVFAGAVSEQEFRSKVDKALSAHKTYIENKEKLSSTSNEANINQPIGDTTDTPAVSTNPLQTKPTGASENEERPEAEDKVAKAKKLLEQVRNKMKQEESAKAKKEEKARIELGKELSKAKSRKEEIELQEAIKEREREKREAIEDRKRVLAQIAADREERKRRNEELRSVPPQKSESSEPGTSCQKRPRFDGNKTRIQFKLPNGSTLNDSFEVDEPFRVLSDYVTSNTVYKTFSLSTIYPKKVFASEDMRKTLRELELAPSSVILVLTSPGPVGKISSVVSTNFFSQIWALVLAPFVAIWGFISRLFNPPAQPTVPPTSPPPPDPNVLAEKRRIAAEREKRLSKRQLESKFMERDGNIARLKDNRDDGPADDNTWNGNSTQQM